MKETDHLVPPFNDVWSPIRETQSLNLTFPSNFQTGDGRTTLTSPSNFQTGDGRTTLTTASVRSAEVQKHNINEDERNSNHGLWMEDLYEVEQESFNYSLQHEMIKEKNIYTGYNIDREVSIRGTTSNKIYPLSTHVKEVMAKDPVNYSGCTSDTVPTRQAQDFDDDNADEEEEDEAELAEQ